MERDIRRFTQVTKDKLSVQSVNRGLTNFVTGAAVEPDVAHDLLNARTMGQKDYEIAVQFYFFKKASIKFQKRKRKLLTFTNTQKKRRKPSLASQEQRTVTFCTKQAIAWAQQHSTSADCIGMQFVEQPRALVDVNNKPTKGQKSYTKNQLSTRYSSILCKRVPENWVPEMVVLDGMFNIHVKPFGGNGTYQDHVKMLLRRFVQPHFKQEVT